MRVITRTLVSLKRTLIPNIYIRIVTIVDGLSIALSWNNSHPRLFKRGSMITFKQKQSFSLEYMYEYIRWAVEISISIKCHRPLASIIALVPINPTRALRVSACAFLRRQTPICLPRDCRS